MVVKKGVAYVQAGAGLVADSVPEKEFTETVNKARALLTALEFAHHGGDPRRVGANQRIEISDEPAAASLEVGFLWRGLQPAGVRSSATIALLSRKPHRLKCLALTCWDESSISARQFEVSAA